MNKVGNRGRTNIEVKCRLPDRVGELGEYLELETVVERITQEAAEDEAEAMIEALDLDRSGFLSVPYRDRLSG